MNELTEAGRYDGRMTNGITYSPIKGVWYDTESLSNTDLEHEFAALVEHAE